MTDIPKEKSKSLKAQVPARDSEEKPAVDFKELIGKRIIYRSINPGSGIHEDKVEKLSPNGTLVWIGQITTGQWYPISGIELLDVL
jgi:hypothetical protein